MEPTTSKRRLPQRAASVARGGSTWIRGSPPTGRNLTRPPETSVTLGATTTWTSSFSSAQAIRRSSLAESTAPPAKNTRLAREASTDQVISSVLPMIGMPRGVSPVPSDSGHSAPTTS